MLFEKLKSFMFNHYAMFKTSFPQNYSAFWFVSNGHMFRVLFVIHLNKTGKGHFNGCLNDIIEFRHTQQEQITLKVNFIQLFALFHFQYYKPSIYCYRIKYHCPFAIVVNDFILKRSSSHLSMDKTTIVFHIL